MIETPILLLLSVGLFSTLAGFLVGVAGVGGIIIIPFLIFVAGMDIHAVIPTCMLGYAGGMPAAVYSYARKGSIRWDKAVYLIVGAAPGAYVGSITVWALPSHILELIIAVFVLFSGLQAFQKTNPNISGTGIDSVSGPLLILIGLVVGWGSSVSGTGGPLLLVPTLLLLNFPILATVGLSMAIQIPITPFASLGHLIHGEIEWQLSVPIAIGAAVGVLYGSQIAHRISPQRMRRMVAIILVGCAILVFSKLFW